jgi:putative serine protease PepD
VEIRIANGSEAGRVLEVSGELTIGREAGCDLVLSDSKVSRRHASIKVLPDGRATLYDLGSSNGTYVNGQRVSSVLLTGNEQVQIGDTVLVPSAGGNGSGPTTMGAAPQASPPPAPPAPPAPPQPPPSFTPPATQPLAPARTQSAIQRIMLQRAVNRATIVGIVAIVLVLVVAGLLVGGVFSSSKSAPSAATIVQQAKPSTLFVVNNQGTAVGRGTGWVWDASKGIVVTNAHVVGNGQQYAVGQGDHLKIDTSGGSLSVTPNGHSAKLLGEADCEDIGVLQVSGVPGLRTVPLGSQQSLKIGDHVIAIGYPATSNTTTDPNFMTTGFTEADLTANTGDVSQVQTTFQSIPGDSTTPTVGPYKNVILTDTVINEGNSGGPLLDDHGRLVGMNSAKNTQNVGQNYAIGVDRIKQIVPQLIQGKNVC